MGHVRADDATFTLNDLVFWQITDFISCEEAYSVLFVCRYIKLRNIAWSSAFLVLKIAL